VVTTRQSALARPSQALTFRVWQVRITSQKQAGTERCVQRFPREAGYACFSKSWLSGIAKVRRQLEIVDGAVGEVPVPIREQHPEVVN
jgi:hypothetical protein